MATEETDGGEFQMKTGLKRKLTGPPRLLLGKPRSPARSDMKSDAQVWRKQQRHKCSEAVEDTSVEDTSVEDTSARSHSGSPADCESQCVMCPKPQTAFAAKEKLTSPDLHEKSPEVTLNLEQNSVRRKHGNNRPRKSRAKAAFRGVLSHAFTCVKRRKKLDLKSEEVSEDDPVHRACVILQDSPGDGNTTQRSQATPSDPFSMAQRCKTEALQQASAGMMQRNVHVRIWPFFKRLSLTSEKKLRKEEGCVPLCTLTATASEKKVELERSPSTDKPECCTSEPGWLPAADEQLNGSSEIHEDMPRILEETCPRKVPDHMEEGTEVLRLSAELSDIPNSGVLLQVCYPKEVVNKHHILPCTVDEEDVNKHHILPCTVDEEDVKKHHSFPYTLDEEDVNKHHSLPCTVDEEDVNKHHILPCTVDEEDVNKHHSFPYTLDEEDVNKHHSLPYIEDEEDVNKHYILPCTVEEEDVNKHHSLPYIEDEEDTKVLITEILEHPGLLISGLPLPSANERSSVTEVIETSSDVPVTPETVVNDTNKVVATENEVSYNPVITIEDTHSSDEENQEPVENIPPQTGRLSTIVSVSGLCYSLKINSMVKDTSPTLDQSDHKSVLSEFVLVQTALSLVRAAIGGAVEQLSAELQRNRTDQHYT